MKRWLIPILLLTALVDGCNSDIDEFRFSGRVVGMAPCNASQIGYVIAIDSPGCIGDTITIDGTAYRNAVVGYRSPRMLSDQEYIYGVAYATHDFAATNCMGLFEAHLPEVILLSVDEEATEQTN